MPANLPLWGLLTRRKSRVDTATELYGRLVAQARHQTFYSELGVPDTPEGRLELLMLHVALLLRRLGREGDGAAALAQTLSERFVTDIDDCLREMGVGDLAVAAKVKKAAAALFDRTRAYSAALSENDAGAIAATLGRALGEGDADAAPGMRRIAAYAQAYDGVLGAASLEDIVAGNAAPPPL